MTSGWPVRWFCLIVWAGSLAACSLINAGSQGTVTPTPAVVFITPTPTTETALSPATVIPPSPVGPPTPADTTGAGPAQANIIISADPETVEVDQPITITGIAKGIGLSYYTLYLDDEPAVTISYDNELKFQGSTGPVVEFESASASNAQVEFILRAARTGVVEAVIGATGEVRLDDGHGNTAWGWGGATSEEVELTVTTN